MSPRFQGSNLDSNLALVEQLRAIADDIGASPAQVAIAWVAAQGNDIVPLVGARRRDRLTEALGALEVKLTDGASGGRSRRRFRPASPPARAIRRRRWRIWTARSAADDVAAVQWHGAMGAGQVASIVWRHRH